MKKKPDREWTVAEHELLQIKEDFKKWVRSGKAMDRRKIRDGKALQKRLTMIKRKHELMQKKRKIPDREMRSVYDEQKQWRDDFKKLKRDYKALDLQKVREGKALFNERLAVIKRKLGLLLKRKKLKRL